MNAETYERRTYVTPTASKQSRQQQESRAGAMVVVVVVVNAETNVTKYVCIMMYHDGRCSISFKNLHYVQAHSYIHCVVMMIARGSGGGWMDDEYAGR